MTTEVNNMDDDDDEEPEMTVVDVSDELHTILAEALAAAHEPN